METDRGSRDCPWIIRTAPGQRLNITLINFARVPPLETAAGAPDPEEDFGPKVCYHLAKIEDRDGYSKTVTGCEREARQKVVHTTTSNEVQISVESTDETSQTYFLLHYTGIGACCGRSATCQRKL